MKVSKKEDWQRKIMIKSMYRCSLLVFAVVGVVIFVFYLLIGHGENMSADPFNYIMDIAVRSLAGPLVIASCLWLFYRRELKKGPYFADLNPDNWLIAGGSSLVLTLIFGMYLDNGESCSNLSTQTAILIGFIFSGCISGIAFAFARSLPILFAIEIIGGSLLMLFVSWTFLLPLGSFVACSSITFYLTSKIMQACEDITHPERTNSPAQQIKEFFVPSIRRDP